MKRTIKKSQLRRLVENAINEENAKWDSSCMGPEYYAMVQDAWERMSPQERRERMKDDEKRMAWSDFRWELNPASNPYFQGYTKSGKPYFEGYPHTDPGFQTCSPHYNGNVCDGFSRSRSDYVNGFDEYNPWEDDMNKQEVANFRHSMKNLTDRCKYSDKADKRPLHRKGSLNRAMDESSQRFVNVITESVINRLRRR